MSIREQVAALIMREGYDVFTACELADKTILEFKASGQKRMGYTVGNSRFVLCRKKG